jgi:hypothetical protein
VHGTSAVRDVTAKERSMGKGKRTRSERSGRGSKAKDDPVSIIRRLGPDGKIVRRGKERLPDAEWEIEVEFTQVGERLYPFRLELRPGIFQDGVPPPGGITARLLHGIKLGELVDQFRAEQRGNLLAQEWFLGRRTKPTYQLPPPSNRAGPKGLGEAFYQDVALAYLEAVRTDPRRPIERMTPSYPGYFKTNVRDWVARARQKGYLTAPRQGRAGGEATQKLEDALRARRKRQRRTAGAVKG